MSYTIVPEMRAGWRPRSRWNGIVVGSWSVLYATTCGDKLISLSWVFAVPWHGMAYKNWIIGNNINLCKQGQFGGMYFAFILCSAQLGACSTINEYCVHRAHVYDALEGVSWHTLWGCRWRGHVC